MRDLFEVAVSALLAFCGLAISYWVLGEWLAAFVRQSFESIRP